jgi:NAD(P)-dependent dehydrogenase (short-subunit alcohol dehydrogenase family)
MDVGEMSQQGTVFVAGGSGGLGQAACARLAEDWGAICFTYHAADARAQALKQELSARCAVDCARMDIRRDDDVAAALAKADAMAGGLKGVVFAAGASILQPFVSEIGQDLWNEVIDIELIGFTRLVRLALPILRRRGGGVFVSVVSFATHRFPPGDAISAVPKAGIEMLTRALAREEGHYGIRANSVAPGIINAGLGTVVQEKVFNAEVWEQQRKRVPLRRFGEAVDVAEAVGFLASSRSSYITGQTIIVDGGLQI